MDPKSTAKSKRIQSQKGRRNHPTPSAVAQKKKASQATREEKPRRAHELPSNWDRYDDEAGGDGDENPVEDKAFEVLPKSKGADFGWLVEQARAQPKESGELGSQFSFDEIPLDFMQGASSMLSIRGEGLLSWCRDDNFIVDDDPSSNYEVPFLSMDLHALAEQLSKLKLSQRLFIEADLLTEDLSADGSKDNRESEQLDMSISNDTKHGYAEPSILNNVKSEKNVISQSFSSNFYTDLGIIQGSLVEKFLPPTSTSLSTKPDSDKDLQLLMQSDTKEAKILMSPAIVDIIPDSEQSKTSRFEADKAEAELDMLLNSFGDTSLSSSLADGSIENISSSQDIRSGSLGDKVPYSITQKVSSPGIFAVTSLDDDLDDLFAATSLSPQEQKDSASAPKTGARPAISLPSHSSLGSDIISDSGSVRQIGSMVPPGDSIDDLLAESSGYVEVQKLTLLSNEQDQKSPHAPRSNPVSDFDSWFDTL
ncbi:uncharacterized protein [Typha angustifolia]|uniref:uncharacterized protein n=1 Tax=Typha angustifolia TaxID=59011 RepID=UPI003C2EED22